ncbi:MAG: hypothetical protein FJ119_09585 [Deltaproteobacteria bacterium]|nr:hypothetical protein [Deltaproteobacteria bacterium]
MEWDACNTVLLYNLPRLTLLPAVEHILRQRGIRFVNVRSGWEVFSIPAFLSIIDPGMCQQGEPWRVDRDELALYFNKIEQFSHLSGCYFFTRRLSIEAPAVIKKRTFPLPLEITESFLGTLVDYSSAACERGIRCNTVQT